MSISIVAVGDISFMGRHCDRPSLQVFATVTKMLKKADMTIGNLESPLTLKDNAIPGKCTLRGNTGWAKILKIASINIVSLANNHIMDYGEEGLHNTIDSLKQFGIRYVGAGNNIQEANAPIFLETTGGRIAVLARSSVEVKSRCYAGKDLSGAAFLDIDETLDNIRLCKKQSNMVLLLVHWGIEEYFYPSPKQRALGRRFFEAGTDIIIGHHPHVIQGIEKFRNGTVAYSLGNFLFDDFDWQTQSQNGSPKTIPVKMDGENRKGMMLQLGIKDGKLSSMTQIFTRIDTDGCIVLDSDKARIRLNKKKSERLKAPFYDYFWKLHSIEREWRIRLNKQIQVRKILANLHKIRPRHIVDLVQALKKSARITSGRSTNPYD